MIDAYYWLSAQSGKGLRFLAATDNRVSAVVVIVGLIGALLLAPTNVPFWAFAALLATMGFLHMVGHAQGYRNGLEAMVERAREDALTTQDIAGMGNEAMPSREALTRTLNRWHGLLIPGRTPMDWPEAEENRVDQVCDEIADDLDVLTGQARGQGFARPDLTPAEIAALWREHDRQTR